MLLTRRPDLTPEPISPTYHRSLSENDAGRNERSDNPVEVKNDLRHFLFFLEKSNNFVRRDLLLAGGR